jgi:transposase InsO family protein
MDHQIKARLQWVKLYEQKQDAGYVCRHCGISRPTLRKWYKRYQAFGIDGLSDQSKRPHHSPNQKTNQQIEKWIIAFRSGRNLGARRIQSELIRLHQCRLSLATIHKVLSKHPVKPIKRLRRKKRYKRYSRPIPGDRVQVDTCKIAPDIYQYTAVDDCTRWRVLDIYKRRTAVNTLEFIDKLVEEFPFPIQRIQSDRGREFFAVNVQKKLMEYGIKFRPIKPASPHLNGKVERSQKTDLEEFYTNVDLSNFDQLREELGYWQFYYNWQRPHGSLKGKTPSQRDSELSDITPLSEEVEALYDPSKEHIQEPNYHLEMKLRELKGCLSITQQ